MTSLLNTTPLTSYMGVELHDLDLAEPPSEATAEAIRQALAEHTLLLVRGQSHISPEQHIAFSRLFGPLEAHVLQNFCLDGHPEIFVVSNIVENGRHIGAYGGSKVFHSDLLYLDEPSLGSVFRCLECPSGTGQTAFASLFAVYDALPEERKRWLAGRNIVYDYVWYYERHHTDRPKLSEEQKARVPPVAHPAVRLHPVTGRPGLFYSPTWARRFEDMSEAESKPILDELTALSTDERFVYYHEWTPGDVLIWDNRASMHKACPFDEQNSRRLMHRTTIKGDRPIGLDLAA
ncbi:MAG: TauD/TfdA family dioxygenase [Gammaproteobacteria bacterium]|nr:TauD/TfdA family dioxygenase [Gammaproteobacteria bacterium]